MPELRLIGCDNVDPAEAARADLFQVSRDEYADIGDAVVATADQHGRIRLNGLVKPWVVGSAAGSFWGLLIGVLFLHPLPGLAAGATAGFITGALGDFGIRDDFAKEGAQVVSPGRAAPFILARSVGSGRIVEPLAGHGGLPRRKPRHADEDKLRAAFLAAQGHAAG
ncbi:DUF1269 domain-containing protein [Roseibacterium sp. SDUM158016]|uniref:DUF1269 domain-containing protein n=1 Tax=Roseicyclus sediminis TaxID=2980997 RepID=UPI0021D2B62F|nr:DUF1269 domain-containing protein [Roseibacterium sp. SDUM158016]MCU4654792.1 DUF1269 domain-containing protein [Roseibacterium sp. SDUM158016]